MSTTSTTFDYHKRKRLKKRDFEDLFESQKCGEKCPKKKWSNDRVHEELSTFITEFSYLTDKKDSKPEVPSYAVYPAQQETNKGIFRHNKGTNRNSAVRHRKSVEWIGQDENDSQHHEEKTKQHKKHILSHGSKDKKNKRHNKHYNYSAVDTRGNKKKKHHKKYDSSTEATGQDYILSSKSEECELCARESRSTEKRQKNSTGGIFIHKSPRSKSRKNHPKCTHHSKNKKSPIKPRRSRSKCRSCEPVSRSSSCGPQVKFIPIKYERKKSKCRKKSKFSIKKENCGIRYESKNKLKSPCVEFKEPVKSSCPSVVTLYPKNSGIKYKALKRDDDTEFLTNPELPCKCFACVRKFESLVRLTQDPKVRICEPNKNFRKPCYPKYPMMRWPNPFICFPRNCLFRPTQKLCCRKTPVRRVFDPCGPDWTCNVPKATPCTNLCYDRFCMSECNVDCCEGQIGDSCFKSVHFKLNCVNQEVDSVVTEYFQSILRNMCKN